MIDERPCIIIQEVRPVLSDKETRAEFLRRWEEDYEAGRETIEPPRNIRFEHDPLWSDRLMSIAYIRSERGIFWPTIGVLFALGQCGFMLGYGYSLRYR